MNLALFIKILLYSIQISASTRIVPSARRNRTKRVLNADNIAEITDYPSMVSFVYWVEQRNRIHEEFLSGPGALITMKWFLASSEPMQAILDRKNSMPVVVVKAGSADETALASDQTSNLSQVIHYVNTSTKPDPGSIVIVDGLLALCELQIPFNESDTVKPAKLPPTLGFSSTCKQVEIVGWGTRDASTEIWPTRSKTTFLRRSEATIVTCSDNILRRNKENVFCVKLIKGEKFALRWDEGMPIFCRDKSTNASILIGFMDHTYGHEMGNQISQFAAVFNISRYMSWIGRVTKVRVPFHAEPVKVEDDNQIREWTENDDNVSRNAVCYFRRPSLVVLVLNALWMYPTISQFLV